MYGQTASWLEVLSTNCNAFASYYITAINSKANNIASLCKEIEPTIDNYKSNGFGETSQIPFNYFGDELDLCFQANACKSLIFQILYTNTTDSPTSSPSLSPTPAFNPNEFYSEITIDDDVVFVLIKLANEVEYRQLTDTNSGNTVTDLEYLNIRTMYAYVERRQFREDTEETEFIFKEVYNDFKDDKCDLIRFDSMGPNYIWIHKEQQTPNKLDLYFFNNIINDYYFVFTSSMQSYSFMCIYLDNFEKKNEATNFKTMVGISDNNNIKFGYDRCVGWNAAQRFFFGNNSVSLYSISKPFDTLETFQRISNLILLDFGDPYVMSFLLVTHGIFTLYI